MKDSLTAEVVVVGGGIVGAAVTHRLAASGHRVAWCVESGPPQGATAASGAMLGVLGEVVAGEHDDDLQLRVRAASRHAEWYEEVGAAQGGVGTFVIASAKRARDLQAGAAIELAAHRHGLACERVDPADVPGLSPASGFGASRILYLPDEAWVDAPQLVSTVGRAAEAIGGVTLIRDVVASVDIAGDRVAGVRTRMGRAVSAEEVVLCTGARVHALLKASGIHGSLVPGLLSAKGVGLRLVSPTESEQVYRHVLRTPNREFACGIHVVPRDRGAVYVGATNRVSRFPKVLGGVTAGEVSLLLGQILRDLAAPLAGWDIAATMSGTRALTLDGWPIAGRTGLAGLSVATGTYRNGVLLAPLLADSIAQELAEPPAARRNDNLFSPGRAVTTADPAVVLRDGLAEMAAQLTDPEDADWCGRLEELLGALGRACAADDAGHGLRAGLLGLLAKYPRIEMVPEAVVELLQAARR